jgi:hypothetical protein
MANVWGSTWAETQVGVLAAAVAAVSPLRRRCPWTTAIWLNRSPRGRGTLVVPGGIDAVVVVGVVGVEMAVVGFFVVGEGFWVEAPARTMATGVVTAANRARLPAATAKRR